MTTIRTTCPACGEVELLPGELSLELTALSGTGNYLFDCPSCGNAHRVVSILLATGVGYEVVDDADRITETEIARFSAALESGDWMDQLLR